MQDQLLYMLNNITFDITSTLNVNNINLSDIYLNNSSQKFIQNINIYNNNITKNLTTKLNASNHNNIYLRRDPLIIVIPMTVIYSLIFISGMLGNIITCLVIAKNRAMHTATNYYLFSLAISDLLLLISGMPLEIYETWFNQYPFGETVCILQGFSAETSANATVLTITAFTAERYIAICHPFLSHTMSKLSRAIKFIFGIWFLAMGLAVPQILDLGILKRYNTCGPKDNARKYVFTISSIVCFILPMVIITVFYVLIGLQLRRSKIVGRATTANGNSIKLKTKYRVPSKRHILITLDKNEKTNTLLSPVPSHHLMEAAVYIENNKQSVSPRTSDRSYDEGRKNYSQKGYMGSRHVVNMLVAVVVAFFVCWAPHHAQRIFAMNADKKYAKIYDILTPISGILYYTSTCINPFLYNIMSYKFREAFKDTCSRCCYQRNGNSYNHNLLSRNISQRSVSHSAHTCSSICSGQVLQQMNSCFLDQDLSILKCTKRPLTVTFRKPRNQQQLQEQQQQQQQQKYDNNDYIESSYKLYENSFNDKTNSQNMDNIKTEKSCSCFIFNSTVCHLENYDEYPSIIKKRKNNLQYDCDLNKCDDYIIIDDLLYKNKQKQQQQRKPYYTKNTRENFNEIEKYSENENNITKIQKQQKLRKHDFQSLSLSQQQIKFHSKLDNVNKQKNNKQEKIYISSSSLSSSSSSPPHDSHSSSLQIHENINKENLEK